MDKKKEEMLEKLRNVKAMENNNLSINRLEDEVQIEDVKFVGQATIIEEIEGEKVEKEINVYAVLEGKNIKYYSDDMCLALIESLPNEKSSLLRAFYAKMQAADRILPSNKKKRKNN